MGLHGQNESELNKTERQEKKGQTSRQQAKYVRLFYDVREASTMEAFPQYPADVEG